MINTMKELRDILQSIPDSAHVRVLVKEGNKIYPFSLSDVEKCPAKDKHGRYQQTVSFVVDAIVTE